jgi:hypothetical protein
VKTDWYCQILPHLPAPPAWLVDRYQAHARPEQQQFTGTEGPYIGLKRREDWQQQSYNWIQPMASNRNMRIHFDSQSLAWIRQNIVSEFSENNSGMMFFEEPQLPHTDSTRDFVLLYNVTTGGADSELCFWHEDQHPLFRDRMTTSERGPHLKKIFSLKGPENAWYLMNTMVLHSVENVTSLRVNLQISFEKNIPESLLKTTTRRIE